MSIKDQLNIYLYIHIYLPIFIYKFLLYKLSNIKYVAI